MKRVETISRVRRAFNVQGWSKKRNVRVACPLKSGPP
jgi:hypothetical protein